MSYFPFFVELSGKKGLIVGGGIVALRKIQRLLPYGPDLTVAAPDICPEIEGLDGLRLIRAPFSSDLLEQADFVIAATDDPSLNHHISMLCQGLRIPINAVDDKDFCTFLFPALVKQGELSIGISTGGASPSVAVYLKEQISAMIPRDFDGLLEYLDGLRETIKQEIPDRKRRSACLSLLFSSCLENGWPLNREQLQKIINNKEDIQE